MYEAYFEYDFVNTITLVWLNQNLGRRVKTFQFSSICEMKHLQKTLKKSGGAFGLYLYLNGVVIWYPLSPSPSIMDSCSTVKFFEFTGSSSSHMLSIASAVDIF